MRLDHDEEEENYDLNLVPMLDMVFNLLLFFLAATTFARVEVEMDLKLPQSKSGAEGKDAHLLIVNVFADGRLVVEGRPVTLEALKQKLEAARARNRDQGVLVRGDKAAQFGKGLEVLDTCRLAKITKVDFAALPDTTK
jgi:biopolymer transport protein ExbD